MQELKASNGAATAIWASEAWRNSTGRGLVAGRAVVSTGELGGDSQRREVACKVTGT